MKTIEVMEPYPISKASEAHECAWCRGTILKRQLMAAGAFGDCHIPKCYVDAQDKYKRVIEAQIKIVLDYCRGYILDDKGTL